MQALSMAVLCHTLLLTHFVLPHYKNDVLGSCCKLISLNLQGVPEHLGTPLPMPLLKQ